jgi:hypothetical protein
MLGTDVICDLVLNDFYAERVCRLDQFTQCCEVTKPVFNRVIVDRVIAVIIVFGHHGLPQRLTPFQLSYHGVNQIAGDA